MRLNTDGARRSQKHWSRQRAVKTTRAKQTTTGSTPTRGTNVNVRISSPHTLPLPHLNVGVLPMSGFLCRWNVTLTVLVYTRLNELAQSKEKFQRKAIPNNYETIRTWRNYNQTHSRNSPSYDSHCTLKMKTTATPYTDACNHQTVVYIATFS